MCVVSELGNLPADGKLLVAAGKLKLHATLSPIVFRALVQ